MRHLLHAVVLAIVMPILCVAAANAGALTAWQDSLTTWHGKPLYEYIQESNLTPVKEIEAGGGKIHFFQLENSGYSCNWNLMTDASGEIVKSSPGDCYAYCNDITCQKTYLQTTAKNAAMNKLKLAVQLQEYEHAQQLKQACAAAGGAWGDVRRLQYPPYYVGPSRHQRTSSPPSYISRAEEDGTATFGCLKPGGTINLDVDAGHY